MIPLVQGVDDRGSADCYGCLLEVHTGGSVVRMQHKARVLYEDESNPAARPVVTSPHLTGLGARNIFFQVATLPGWDDRGIWTSKEKSIMPIRVFRVLRG